MISRKNRTLPILIFLLALSACAESHYFYTPSTVVDTTPLERGLAHEEVTFSSSDGTMLTGWFVPAQGERHGTVIHFHGNNKNIAGHLRYVEWLPSRGYDVFLFDYRGYGKSGGTPATTGVHDDCVAALNYLRGRHDIAEDRIIVFGQSLGGVCALGALTRVARTGIRAVIIEGAFASHREIARDKLAGYMLPRSFKNWLIDLLISDRYDAVSALPKFDDVPILVIHNVSDEVVPIRHAQLLLASNPANATLWLVPPGRHLDTFVLRGEAWRDALLQYLHTLDSSMALPEQLGFPLFHNPNR